MANSRGLLVIGVFLAVVHVCFTQHTHCTVHRKSVKRINSNWEKVDSAELGGSSSGIAANFDKARVLTVAKEAGQGDFTTVQGAINAVPVHNKNPVVINVRPGIYREKVTIPAEKPFVRVSGSDANSTVITWNDSAKSSGGTYYSATVSVYASDFTARKITITNSYGPGNLTPEDQAVAVRISGDRSAFYDCRFLGVSGHRVRRKWKALFSASAQPRIMGSTNVAELVQVKPKELHGRMNSVLRRQRRL